MVLRSQSSGAAAKKTTSEDKASDDEVSDDGALEICKSDSGIYQAPEGIGGVQGAESAPTC